LQETAGSPEANRALSVEVAEEGATEAAESTYRTLPFASLFAKLNKVLPQPEAVAVSDVVLKQLRQCVVEEVVQAKVAGVSLDEIESELLDIVREHRVSEGDHSGAPEKFSVDNRSPQEIVLSEVPHIRAAVAKLMSQKGRITYQRATGRAAINVMDWMRINFIESGVLTARELSSIPVWVFRNFDPRLYHALFNSWRSK